MNQGITGTGHVTFHSTQIIIKLILHETFLYIINYKLEKTKFYVYMTNLTQNLYFHRLLISPKMKKNEEEE
jgi:hypothetical protein